MAVAGNRGIQWQRRRPCVRMRRFMDEGFCLTAKRALEKCHGAVETPEC